MIPIAWKEQVAVLEAEGNFDIAIFLLEKVIKENPSEMDAYIFLLYRFMDSFLENSCYWANCSSEVLKDIKREYCEAKISHDYAARAQKCFDESYDRFSDNPEYLYYVYRILVHSYWFISLNIEEGRLDDMYNRAMSSGYNKIIEERNSNEVNDVTWAKKVMQDFSLKEQLATKGAAGEYIVGEALARAKGILEKAIK